MFCICKISVEAWFVYVFKVGREVFKQHELKFVKSYKILSARIFLASIFLIAHLIDSSYFTFHMDMMISYIEGKRENPFIKPGSQLYK